MIIAWIVVSCILAIIWLIAFVVGHFFFIVDPDGQYSNDPAGRKSDYQIYAAILTGGFIFVFIHWMVLLAIVPAFVFYGLWSGVKILYRRPWRKGLTNAGRVV